MENFQHYLLDLKIYNIQIASLYVKNHPILASITYKRHEIILTLWIKNLYDANVNLAHFDSLHYHQTGKATFPLIGECDATLLTDCKECKDAPENIRSIYDIGTNIHAAAQLKPGYEPLKGNPLHSFDPALFKVGEFQEGSDYIYNMNLAPAHVLDLELIDFMSKRGIDCLLPTVKPNLSVHDPDSTFTTAYNIKSPQFDSIKEDLELFNQHTYGSASPIITLMASDLQHQLMVKEVLCFDFNSATIISFSVIIYFPWPWPWSCPL